MNEPMANETDPALRAVDLAAVLLRRWKWVLGAALLVPLIAVATRYLLTARYNADTLLVPFAATQQSGGLALAQLPAGVGGMLGLPQSGNDRMVGVVLGSRTLLDSLVARLGTTPERTAEIHEIFWEHTRVNRATDGSIRIEVAATTPELAVAIVGAYPVILNSLLSRVNTDGANRKEAFLRMQLDSAREALVRSEERMLSFGRGVPSGSVDEAGAARTLQAAAEAQQAINEQEVRVAQLRQSVTEQNPQMQAALAELATRRAQLRRLTDGGSSQSRVFTPLGEGAQVRVTSTRLLRDYTQNERVYQSLTAALAQTQIDANNTLPVLTVLDAPVLPGAPARSPLWKLVIIWMVVGLLLGMAVVLLAEALRRVGASPRSEPLVSAWRQVRGELGLGRRSRAGAR
jgi:hypothetical protein